ncbi:MAG: hypothetical protein U1A27_14495 [Phycisphaerae bacterium]
MPLCGWACVIVALSPALSTRFAIDEPGATSGPTTAAATTAPTEKDRIQPGTLSPATWDSQPVSEAQLNQRIGQRLNALRQQASQAGDPLEAACTELNAVELILSRQIEPALSRELLGVASTADRKSVVERVRAASELLASADGHVKASKQEVPDELADRLATAHAYAELFGAVFSGPRRPIPTQPASQPTSPVDERIIAACRGLASLIDDGKPPVAAGARLWQAAAYRRAGRADRALQVLPLASAPMTVVPLDIFSRLERCRALADLGQPAAAIALLMQLDTDSRLGQALPNSERGAARHALALLHAQILDRWADSLSEADRRDNEAALREQAAALRTEIVEHDVASLRLGSSVGGMDRPLVLRRPTARLAEIPLSDSLVTLVIEPAHTTDDAWADGRRKIVAALAQLDESQSVAVIAAQGKELKRFPAEGSLPANSKELRKLDQFLARARNGAGGQADLAAALAEALALRARSVVLVTADEPAAARLEALAKALHDSGAKLHVAWLGAPGAGEALAELARNSGGTFARLAPPGAATQETPSGDDDDATP